MEITKVGTIQNTDQDWAKIGETDPYFGVLSHEAFRRSNMTDETRAYFWQTGVDEIGRYRDQLVHQFGEFSTSAALDFGCGVGRLSRALSAYADRVYGIDISPGMLAEAQIGAPENCTFSSALPDEQVDWINSMIVFQHIQPERGYMLFDALLNRLSLGGMLSVHFTIFKDRQGAMDHSLGGMHFSTFDGQKIRTVLPSVPNPGAMSMYDYDLNILIAMMVRRGVSKFFMRHDNQAGCHGVHIFARRDA